MTALRIVALLDDLELEYDDFTSDNSSSDESKHFF
jgi:hypothetical protein